MDGCHVVERGSITASNMSVKVPAPELLACTFLLCAHVIVPSETLEITADYAADSERALEWVPTWHFERRAAPPSRAPSVILA
jgi:hypothetical protein